jgi:hypothetical protein
MLTFSTRGEWCPFACTSGKLMNQWNPNAIAYVHPDKEQGVSTVVKTAFFKSLSPIATSVSKPRPSSLLLTCLISMFSSAKPSSQAMRECAFPTMSSLVRTSALRCLIGGTGQALPQVITSTFRVMKLRRLVFGAITQFLPET